MRKRTWVLATLLLLVVASLAVAELRSGVISRRTGVRGFGYHYYLVAALVRELHDDAATGTTAADELTETVNELISTTGRDQVLASTTAGTITGVTMTDDDGAAEDYKTTVAVVIQHKGRRFAIAVDAAINLGGLTCGGDIITVSKAGCVWAFVNPGGTHDAEQPVLSGTQAYTSAILALAGYSTATNTLPPGSDDVAIGVVSILEEGSGDFTIGTDTIATETEVYYSFEGLPGVITPGTIEFDDEATFDYSANSLRLGTGTVVTGTGKNNVTISTDTVVTTYTGVWFFYMLADDSEAVVQLGSYASTALAQAAVRDHTPNPLLPLVGVIYVANASGSTFTGATTKLDATGITTTIDVQGIGSDHLEIGRAALNQPHQVLQNAGATTLTAAKPNAIVPGDR